MTMSVDEPNLDRSRPSWGWLNWVARIPFFRKFFKPCENPECDISRRLLSSRNAEGIRLQGHWYCSPECFEHMAESEFLRLIPPPEFGPKKSHRLPIGLLLLSKGVISDIQLKQALSMQKEKGGGKIGKFLQDIRAVTEQDLTVGLASQWGCPVYPLVGAQDFLNYIPLLPLTLLEEGRMLPVHHIRAQQELYIGFVEGIDRTALYAVEQMLGLRTIPCIVAESAYLGVIEELRHIEGAQTTVFETGLNTREMAHTTRSYASQVGAMDVSMVRSGQFIWVRLQNAQGTKDILFQIPRTL